MKKIFLNAFAVVLCTLLALPSFAQQSDKSRVKLVLTREANGINSLLDTTFYVTDEAGIETVLERLGVSESNENLYIEKNIIVKNEVEESQAKIELDVPAAAPRPQEEKQGPVLVGVWVNDYHVEGRQAGVKVSGLISGYGAEKTDVMAGDVIVSINGTAVNNCEQLEREKKKYQPGDIVDMTYVQDGNTRTEKVLLKEKGTINTQRPKMGVYVSDVSEASANAKGLPNRGVKIDGTTQNGGAKAAGLKAGDIVLALDGTPINSTSELTRAIRKHQVGDDIQVKYWRDGSVRNTSSELKGSSSSSGNNWNWNWNWDDKNMTSGCDQNNYSKTIIKEKKAFMGITGSSSSDGVRLTSIVRGEAAEAAGLEKGDIVIEMNGEDVDDMHDLKDVLKEAEAGQSMSIRYIRDGKKQRSTMTLGEKENTIVMYGTKEQKVKKMYEVYVLAIELGAEEPEEASTENTEVSEEEDDRWIGLKEMNIETLQLYPNPNEGQFNLRFNLENRGDTRIEIFNLEGKQVYEEVIEGFQGTYDNRISLSNPTSGVYFLRIIQNKKFYMRKVVVQ